MSYRLAYVKVCFIGGHDPEALLFDGIPGFDVTFVGYTGEKIPGSNVKFLKHANYAHVGFQKLLPYSVTNLVMRQPPSAPSFVILRKLDDRLKDTDIIVSSEVYSFMSRQCASISAKLKERFVVEVWETLPNLPLNFFPPYSWNVHKVKKYADLFIVHTKRSERYLRSLTIPGEKIRSVCPGIDLDIFSSSRKNDHGKFRILFIGRFDKEKGLSLLLQAFVRLHKNLRNVELWIRAKKCTGQIYAKALEASKKYPVKFIDFVPYTELPKLYRSCDVLCLPSCDLIKYGFKVWEEQFGYALMEAMACGLPIVSTYCGAIPEVAGPNNLLVPQNSAHDLYLAIYTLAKDEEYRNYLSRANRLRAEKLFDIKKQKIKLMNILKSVLG